MRFGNPANGYVEEKSVPSLWALLFGGIYFLASGLRAPAIVCIILALIFLGLMGGAGWYVMFVVDVIYAALPRP